MPTNHNGVDNANSNSAEYQTMEHQLIRIDFSENIYQKLCEMQLIQKQSVCFACEWAELY